MTSQSKQITTQTGLIFLTILIDYQLAVAQSEARVIHYLT